MLIMQDMTSVGILRSSFDLADAKIERRGVVEIQFIHDSLPVTLDRSSTNA